MSAPHDMHYDIVAQAFVEGGVVPFLGAGDFVPDVEPLVALVRDGALRGPRD